MALPILGLCAVALVGAKLLAAPRAEPASARVRPGTPVIVELFSSEGCSSCPPADAYLAELDRAQSVDGVVILALEEHVDYWDDLGWRDPFAQSSFGARQRQYASVLPDHRIYTPEIVIDGRDVFAGDRDQGAAAMQIAGHEPRAVVSVKWQGGRAGIDVDHVPAGADDDPTEVWLAMTESGLSTHVERGENAGRVLDHAPVVRVLRKLGLARPGASHFEAPIDVDPAWKAEHLRVVAFVQRSKSRRIVGASSS